MNRRRRKTPNKAWGHPVPPPTLRKRRGIRFSEWKKGWA